MVTIVWVVGRK